jgi:hypothetical protein
MPLQGVIMRIALTCFLLAFALSSHAFAVLRPRHPTKPRLPFRGELGMIEDDSGGARTTTAPDTTAK